MDRERWQRIEELYHAARAHPAPAREAFLQAACGNDESLRGEVASLLAQPEDSWTALVARHRDGDEIVGKRIGHFDVQLLLGAGGMGRVYRARDTRLGRDVALKLLPPEWITDPDRRARLEREARLLASLNHPNIATIHGVEDVDGLRALVLEYIEGDTLADRIARGPLPAGEAVAIVRQVKDALDAAHERGIVHRDLKPANIKITPDGLVKVLDFGLAVLEPERDGRAPDRSQAPTVTARGTREGVVAGTAAYMSPEQARGLAIDKRTDIWAFGCVLYEMLAGRPAFARATLTDTLAAIVEREPDWSALPGTTPPGLVRLLKRCLDKDRRRRLRDIGDADAEPATPGEPLRTRRSLAAALAVAIVSVAGTALIVGRLAAPSAAAPSTVALNLVPPNDLNFSGLPVPSPDGARIAFVTAASDEAPVLWVRGLADTTARRLTGTEGAYRPFWSPDSRFIAFAAEDRMKRVDADTGTVQTICVCVTEMLGGTWGANNVIVFAPVNRSPLHRVSATGGTSEPLTALDATRNENSHRWPSFLPDGRHILYTARSDITRNTGVYLAEVGSDQRQWLIEAQSPAMYAPPGRLLFARERTLLAQAFDFRAARLSGEPVPVAAPVDHYPASTDALFAVSADGTVLTHGGGFGQSSELVRFDATGVRQGAIGEQAGWQDMKLSPDATRAALVRNDETSGNRDIWLVEIATGRGQRWSTHPANDWQPVWSPDGRQLAFASDRNGASAIFKGAVDGSGGDELVVAAAGPAAGRFPRDWSRDDRLIMGQDTTTATTELWVAPVSGHEAPRLLQRTGRVIAGGRISPDGRWLAYVSDESGAPEVYVSPLDGSSKHRVSSAGGLHPRWRPNATELLYVGVDRALMSVAVDPGSTFKAASPKRLFASCLTSVPPLFTAGFEVAGDGSTFWLCPGSGRPSGTVTVSLDWLASRRTASN
jgi:Tol biopolymer transport system component